MNLRFLVDMEKFIFIMIFILFGIYIILSLLKEIYCLFKSSSKQIEPIKEDNKKPEKKRVSKEKKKHNKRRRKSVK